MHELSENQKLVDYLKEILPNIDDKTAQGIAKLAIEKGMHTLSSAQLSTLNKGIADYIVRECPNCGHEVDYHDMSYVLANGICGLCQHDRDKNYAD